MWFPNVQNGLTLIVVNVIRDNSIASVVHAGVMYAKRDRRRVT